MSVEEYSRTAADNADPTKGGWKEKMDRDTINDQARTNLADIRTLVENGEWVDLLVENNNDFTPSRGGTTTVIVSDNTGTDATEHFSVGSWCKVVGTGTPTIAYGSIASVSAYGGGQITVTLENITDTSYVASDLPSSTVTQILCYWNRLVRQSAFHPVGTTLAQAPAEIPTIDDLGDGATVDMGTGNGFDADTVDGLHASAFQLAGAVSANALINSDFSIWQRGDDYTPAVDADYIADRWVFLGETAAEWDVHHIEATTTAGDVDVIELQSQTAGSGTKAGILQIISGSNSNEIIANGKASLSFLLLLPNTTGFSKVRAGILSWQGTEDAPTRDAVSAWSVEGTDPVLVANWSYENTPVSDEASASASWQSITIEDITIDPLTVNLGVFIWVEDKSHSSGDQWYVTRVQLEAGSAATAYQHLKIEDTYRECQLYYQKTYNFGVTPGTAAATAGQRDHTASRRTNFTAGQCIFEYRYGPMYRTPTVHSYAPVSGAIDSATISGQPDSGTTINNAGTDGCVIEVDDAANNKVITLHATAEAEF
jgi:hypothetical protein